MDNYSKIQNMESDKTSKKWTKEEPFNEGKGTIYTCVEEVSNGFIKTIRKQGEQDGKYICKVVKSIHKENPFEELTLADKLEKVLKKI